MAKSRGRKFAEITSPTSGVFDLTSVPTITNAKLQNSAMTLAGSSVSLGGTGVADTDALSEGSSNLYFTDARVQTFLGGGTLAGNIVVPDNRSIYVGSNSDFRLYHDTTDTQLVNATGILKIISNGGIDITGDLTITDKIIHSGDTDTFFRFAGANDIRIVAGNVEHAAFDVNTIVFNQSGANMDFRVESTGNESMLHVDAGNDRVGIGTNSPTEALTIKGDGLRMTIESDDYENVMIGRRGSSGADLDKGFFRMKAEGVNKVILDTAGDSYLMGGNVGIGSPSAPPEKLHVYTTGNSRVEAESTTGVAAFKATNNSGSYAWYVDNTADKFHLYDFTDSAQRVTLDGSGNVGIGPSSPGYKLDVGHAASGAIQARFKSSGDTGYTQGAIVLESSDSSDSPGSRGQGVYMFNHGTDRTWYAGTLYSAPNNYGIGTVSGTSLQVSAADDGISGLAFVINSSGNVGIGNTGSSAIRLNVATPTANHVAAQIENSNTADSFGLIVKGGNDANDYTADFRKRDNTNILRIRGDGKVGIGTTSPASLLELRETFVGNITGGNARQGAVLTLHHEAQWENGYTGGDFLGAINFSTGDSSTGEGVRAAIKTSVDSYYNTNKMRFYVATGTTLTERMQIKNNGNVGIGSTDPFARSHISDTNWSSGAPYGTVQLIEGRATNDHNWSQLVVTDTDDSNGNGGAISFATGSASALNPFASIKGYREGSNHGALDFYTRPSGGTSTWRMRINSSGNVGIGEDTPLGKLHVKTADSGASVDVSADELVVESNGNAGISILSGQSYAGSIYFGDAGVNWDGYIAYSQAARKFTFGAAAGAMSLSVDSTGIYTQSYASDATNTVYGADAFTTNASGAENNTIIGKSAWYRGTTGSNNVVIGHNACLDNVSNINQMASSVYVGKGSGLYNAGNLNVVLGTEAGYRNYGGSSVLIGYRAGGYANSSSSGNSNVCVGMYSLYNVTSGSDNVVLGKDAGDTITTGIRNVCIGRNANPSQYNGEYQIILGHDISGPGDNHAMIGRGGQGYWKLSHTVNTGWVFVSDERIKKNIQKDTLGLEFINKIRPVTYNHKKNEEIDKDFLDSTVNWKKGDADDTVLHRGLVAQEVKAAMKEVGNTDFDGWSQDDDGMQGISKEAFITPLINAVKELSAEVTALKAEVAALKGG